MWAAGINHLPIDALFTNNGQALSIDLNGLDLVDLNLILAGLAGPYVDGTGYLAGPKS